MTMDPTDTDLPHLDLDDLVAGANGQPMSERAGEHVADCEHCQAEAQRWNLVAGAVRGLAAAAPDTAPDTAPTASRPQTRPHPHGPWRRPLLVATSAAAALVLVAGVGIATGDVHVRLGGRSSEPVLTAVTGCDELQQANGTLERVDGASLVIQTPGGRPLTVTTTPSTFVSTSGPLLREITDGASVMVRGQTFDGTIRAAVVTVGEPFGAVNPPGSVPVEGTVTDAHAGRFALVTSAGTRVRVTTSEQTLVVVPHAHTDQLQTGTQIFALGNAGPNRTLSARALAAVSQLPGTHRRTLAVKDCSTNSIVEAIGAVSQAPPDRA